MNSHCYHINFEFVQPKIDSKRRKFSRKSNKKMLKEWKFKRGKGQEDWKKEEWKKRQEKKKEKKVISSKYVKRKV